MYLRSAKATIIQAVGTRNVNAGAIIERERFYEHILLFPEEYNSFHLAAAICGALDQPLSISQARHTVLG
jgi:hypothetical protein